MRKVAITLISLFTLITIISGQTVPNCDDPIMGADCYYTEANPEDGTHTIILVVTDGFCYDTAYVTIDATKESLIVVPNVFTPNGDGSNDVFKLIELNLISVEGEIYNRWGQKLYSWNGLNGSKGWLSGKNKLAKIIIDNKKGQLKINNDVL